MKKKGGVSRRKLNRMCPGECLLQRILEEDILSAGFEKTTEGHACAFLGFASQTTPIRIRMSIADNLNISTVDNM